MPYHSVLEYIRKATDAGADTPTIERCLHDAGWYTVDIRDALQLHATLTSASAPAPLAQPMLPEMPHVVHARQYHPRVIAVAVVTFAVVFIGYLVLTR